MHRLATALVLALAIMNTAHADTLYAPWDNGPPNDPAYFPIGVWLQDPGRADDYADIGVNVYIGLWAGPTEQQLTALQAAGMHAITSQNAYTRSLVEAGDPLADVIVAWMQQDEPDNAQAAEGGGWGPPVTPEQIRERYEAMREIDPTRPIYLNLGQGVAWNGWHGRGVRTNEPGDYLGYQRGADILSFDIYPAAANPREGAIAGQIWRVAYGTQRLRDWTDDDKPVWAILEGSDIHGHGKATAQQLRAEAWMAVIHGATGITYFVHSWNRGGEMISEHALLNDDELRPAARDINATLTALAPVIHSPSIEDRLDVLITDGERHDDIRAEYRVEPVAAMLKEHDGALYLFTVRTRDSDATARFTIAGLEGTHDAEVIGEDRTVTLEDGSFEQTFNAWDTHLYRIPIDEP
ncbi:MAG: hypothetical protein WD009_03310 [Phycisphaeraceae bacterium]